MPQQQGALPQIASISSFKLQCCKATYNLQIARELYDYIDVQLDHIEVTLKKRFCLASSRTSTYSHQWEIMSTRVHEEFFAPMKTFHIPHPGITACSHSKDWICTKFLSWCAHCIHTTPITLHTSSRKLIYCWQNNDYNRGEPEIRKQVF